MTKSSRFPLIKQLAQMTFLAVCWNCVLIPSALFLLVFLIYQSQLVIFLHVGRQLMWFLCIKKVIGVISKTIAQLHLHQLLSKCWRVLFLTIFAIISWLMVLCTQTNIVSPQGNHVLQCSPQWSCLRMEQNPWSSYFPYTMYWLSLCRLQLRFWFHIPWCSVGKVTSYIWFQGTSVKLDFLIYFEPSSKGGFSWAKCPILFLFSPVCLRAQCWGPCLSIFMLMTSIFTSAPKFSNMRMILFFFV